MFKRILFPVDLESDASWTSALPIVIALTRTFSAKLHVLTVFPELPTGIYELDVAAEAGRRLEAAATDGLASFVSERVPNDIDVTRHVERGGVFHAILTVAEQVGADLIVMASHRPETSDYLIGSNASRVVRHATMSVLVVR